MKTYRQRLGRHGEEVARRRLEQDGYKILESNYRTPSGEIDLIGERDGTIVFAEVRTRRGDAFGSPEESITAAKRARLVSTAQEYLQDRDAAETDWRIDVIALQMDGLGRLLRLEITENAVQL